MSSTTKFNFYYIKGYMFRPYNQVIIRPTSKLSLQMLEVGLMIPDYKVETCSLLCNEK